MLKILNGARVLLDCESKEIFIDIGDGQCIPLCGSGGSAFIDVTASVGQTFVVEEVDARGKVTKVKAADYQEKICSSEEIVVLEETTITPNADGHLAFSPLTVPSMGDICKVTYNGTEYACEAVDGFVATEIPGTVMLGNVSLATGTGDTGEPFILVIAVAGENGGQLMPMSALDGGLDGSETFVLSIKGEVVKKIPNKFVPTLEEMRTTETVILPETTGEHSEDDEGFLIPFVELVGDAKYNVVYNGVKYICECVDGRDDTGVGEIFLGNLPLLDETGDNGIPFVVGMATDGVDGMGIVIPLDGAETVTLSITEVKTTPIPVQYLSEVSPYYVQITSDGTALMTFITPENLLAQYKLGREIYAKTAAAGQAGQMIIPLTGVDIDTGDAIFSTRLAAKHSSGDYVFTDVLILLTVTDGVYSVTMQAV